MKGWPWYWEGKLRCLLPDVETQQDSAVLFPWGGSGRLTPCAGGGERKVWAGLGFPRCDGRGDGEKTTGVCESGGAPVPEIWTFTSK